MSLRAAPEKFGGSTAIVEKNGRSYTYQELLSFSDDLAGKLDHREKKLVLILCGNNIESIGAYLAVLRTHHAAILLDSGIDVSLFNRVAEAYEPDYIWMPARGADNGQGGGSYEMVCRESAQHLPLHPDLKLLLPTSGSTGSPKLVRLTSRNLDANASAIASYLRLDSSQRPITALPVHYSYGLSVINSHLLVGATILLTRESIMSRPFWDFFKAAGATSIAGVPFTYEMLKRLNFFGMDLPSLRYMTQAGGRLAPALVREFASFSLSRGLDFFVMYGQTEATARISYLPPEKMIDKPASVGIPIPGGSLAVVNESGESLSEPFKEGELVYRGANVMMGYANCRDDLAKGDELHGVLHTGDMGYYDEDYYFYITGRNRRFLKIFGNRLSLDDVEDFLKEEGLCCVCGGKDDLLCIVSAGEVDEGVVIQKVTGKFKVHHSAVRIMKVDEIPVNAAGKVCYAELFRAVGS